MFKIIIIAFLVFVTTVLYAEDKEAIIMFEDKITIRTALALPQFLYRIQNKGPDSNKTKDIHYYPNFDLVYKLEIFYKNFGISLSGNAEPTNEKLYGSSDIFDFQLYYIERKFIFEAIYQQYKGFFLENSKDFGMEVGDSKTIFPNSKATYYALNGYYIFSDDFSFNAAIYQIEKQNKWDWSFLIHSTIHYLNLSSDRSFIPDDQKIYYGDNSEYKGGKYSSVGLAPGLAITVPFCDFYITTSLFLGGSVLNRNYDKINGHVDDYTLSYISNLKLAIGYNGDKYFYGLVASGGVSNTSGLSDDNFDLSFSSGYSEWFFGLRF